MRRERRLPESFGRRHLTLFEKLAAETAAEIEAIERDARAQEDAILRAADDEARRIVAAAKREAHDRARRAATSARSEAELATRAAIGAHLEAILVRVKEASFDAARKLMEEDYPKRMASLIAEGASHVGSERVDAELPTRDRDLFASHEARIRESIELRKVALGRAQCTLLERGGCVVYSADHRRAHTATFEELFRRMEEEIRGELVARLTDD